VQLEYVRAKLFLKKQETHTIYFSSEIHVHGEENKNKLPFIQKKTCRSHQICMQNKLHAEQIISVPLEMSESS